MNKKIGSNLVGITILVLSFGVPIVRADPYVLHVMTVLWLNIILTTSLWLLYSTGEVSLANVSFMAIGAYSSAVLTKYAGVSFWVCLPLAGVLSGGISFFIGYPALRVKGFSFFTVTVAVAEIILLLLSNFKQDILGGQTGIEAVPPPNPIQLASLSISFDSKTSMYYLVLAITILCIIVVYRLINSKFGRVSRAISQADLLAETLGINSLLHKMLAFTIVGFFSGIVGSLYAHSCRFVSPWDFSVHRMIMLVCFVIIGGTKNIWGPIVGALVFTLLSVFFGKLGHLEILIAGITVILVLRFFPDGLIGVVDLFRRKSNS